LGDRGTQNARWGGMKSRLGTVVALVFALAAGACFAPQQESMAGALDRYIGRPVADFAADHGEPTSSMIETGDRKAAFRWVLTGQRQCTVILDAATTNGAKPALKDWTILSWRWDGAC
jgi:hypothetical protein